MLWTKVASALEGLKSSSKSVLWINENVGSKLEMKISQNSQKKGI